MPRTPTSRVSTELSGKPRRCWTPMSTQAETLLDARHEGAFMIGVVGPSRVGKTSLISAILRDSQDLLAGTAVEVQSADTATGGRLSLYRRALNGSLAARHFVSHAMQATQEPVLFLLH